jgi:hypothetical protein
LEHHGRRLAVPEWYLRCGRLLRRRRRSRLRPCGVYAERARRRGDERHEHELSAIDTRDFLDFLRLLLEFGLDLLQKVLSGVHSVLRDLGWPVATVAKKRICLAAECKRDARSAARCAFCYAAAMT